MHVLNRARGEGPEQGSSSGRREGGFKVPEGGERRHLEKLAVPVPKHGPRGSSAREERERGLHARALSLGSDSDPSPKGNWKLLQSFKLAGDTIKRSLCLLGERLIHRVRDGPRASPAVPVGDSGCVEHVFSLSIF